MSDDERELISAQLRVCGERLRQAQAADQAAHDAIVELLAQALAAGLSKREIARLTGVGRPWIDKSLRDNAGGR